MLRNLNHLSKALKFKPITKPLAVSSFHSSKALKNSDNFMSGTNSVYLEQMYDNWVRDKSSVHPSWDAYFSNISSGLTGEQAFIMPPTQGQTFTPSLSRGTATGVDSQKQMTESLKIFMLVKSYQRRGHELADLDPLSKKWLNYLF